MFSSRGGYGSGAGRGRPRGERMPPGMASMDPNIDENGPGRVRMNPFARGMQPGTIPGTSRGTRGGMANGTVGGRFEGSEPLPAVMRTILRRAKTREHARRAFDIYTNFSTSPPADQDWLLKGIVKHLQQGDFVRDPFEAEEMAAEIVGLRGSSHHFRAFDDRDGTATRGGGFGTRGRGGFAKHDGFMGRNYFEGRAAGMRSQGGGGRCPGYFDRGLGGADHGRYEPRSFDAIFRTGFDMGYGAGMEVRGRTGPKTRGPLGFEDEMHDDL